MGVGGNGGGKREDRKGQRSWEGEEMEVVTGRENGGTGGCGKVW